MDKKSIIGIAIMGVIFFVFALVSNLQEKNYQEEVAKNQVETPVQKTEKVEAQEVKPMVKEQKATLNERTAEPKTKEQIANEVRQKQTMLAGEGLMAAQLKKEDIITIENDDMTILFSTRGARVIDVTLKNYTKYAPRDERTELVKLFDPETSSFAFTFPINRGLGNWQVNTQEYTFDADPIKTKEDGSKELTMRLNIDSLSSIEYVYTVHQSQEPSTNFLVDFDLRLHNMEQYLKNQSSLGIHWANVSYQNERGFKNENMYTTVAYRLPEETAIEELGMSEDIEKEEVVAPVNWVAFKQQYFSSVFIAPKNVSYANMAFATEAPGSTHLKQFAAKMSVPYDEQTTAYDFAFYFGPNEYTVLNHVGENNEELYGDLYLERLVPLGWGIFGWVNRWCVIPVFNFLRNYISSFGIIIFILVLLVKLVISPLTYKSYVSMAKMRLIKPEVDELNQKFPRKEDAMKRQQATMELYKKAGINPMGGCIPLLIQLPILYAMFRFFPASIELRGQAFLWAEDLSSYDSILQLPFTIPWYGDHISLFALLMAVSIFGYSYYNYQQTASSQPQMAGMKFMMLYMMPLMMLLWFNSYSSGLCYYYLLSNLFTIGQTLVIRRLVDDNKIRAVMEANAAKKSKGKKSKFQLRYEQLMREQEARQKAKK